MNNVHGRPIPLNIYKKNKTMRLLGYQYSADIFWADDVKKEIGQIRDARPNSFTIDAAADIFILGYIHGKRAERARRKK